MSSISAVASSPVSYSSGAAQLAAQVSNASDAVTQASASMAEGGGGAVGEAIVQQAAAVYAFKAGIQALQVQSQLIGSLVNVHV